MVERFTVRTVATLVTALCVATMFTGSVAALGLNDMEDSVNVSDNAESSPVGVDVAVGGEQSTSGGSGTGTVAVGSAEGNASGTGTVGADAEDGLTVEMAGEGDSQGEALNGSLACNLSPDETNPGNACESTTPGGDEAPVEPGEDLPINPGDEAPVEPGDDLPVDPGDEAPITPGDDLPINPGSGELPPELGELLAL